MRKIHIHSGGKAWTLLVAGALTAAVWLAAGDASAWPFRKKATAAGGKRDATSLTVDQLQPARGRIRSQPQAMVEGRLDQDSRGQWQLDGRPLVFESRCMLLDATQGSRRALPQPGRRAFLMGYERAGRFVAFSGVLLESPPPERSAPTVVPDQTEAEALAAAGFAGLHPDEVPR